MATPSSEDVANLEAEIESTEGEIWTHLYNLYSNPSVKRQDHPNVRTMLQMALLRHDSLIQFKIHLGI